ncbi:hypothetical protein Ade02nite_15110 [Paractinoplanes deccanensis]|uniref:AAA+ ATPase domain-containing protein n=1 Tax=Paractinoplanes deccanensis TaxID=113561 RepID=A0ABQ3XYZ6_9ACTN|nr:ATP-binding protein [Actinoplanes deccanensis]GID72870.1 hypothetical protein Ade02nite_15110 [Actinoplanes deccanensis]
MSELPALPARAAALAERLAGLCAEPVDELIEGLRAESDTAAAHRLAAATGLTPFEFDLLLLAGLPEEHEALCRLARRLHPGAECWFTPAVAAAVLELDAAGRAHLRRALEAGPLRRFQLVTGPDTVPLPERGLRLPPGLWSVLRGVDCWPAALHPMDLPDLPGSAVPPVAAGGPHVPGSAVPGSAVPGSAVPGSAAVGSAAMGSAVMGSAVMGSVVTSSAVPLTAADGPRVVVVTGDGRDDHELAALAAAWVADPAGVPAAELDGDRAPMWTVHLLARGATPIVVGAPPAPPLPGHPGPVVVACAAAGFPLDDRPAVTVELPRPGLGDAIALWRDLLPGLNGAATELAGLLRVGRIGAVRAVRDTEAAGAVTVGAVVDRVRRRTELRLPASVRLVRPRATLDRLVLPESRHRALRSVVDRVRGQARVLHEWGFGDAARHPGGVRLLLSGPPGTGKTLAVEAVAGELGLDLLVVDLAALVSKWLGETEKNIAEVFDAAERCQAVLFFDEADAVFGRRTDASDAQGRWANLETAYLLGRIDRSDGLVALATNLRRNVDDAFVRRLDVILDLEEPDRPARELLWRRHLPAGAPIAADVDASVLAALYETPGGLIRNAALSAAYVAAAGGRPIDQDALIDAVRDEYRKAGRSFPGAPRARGGTRHG